MKKRIAIIGSYVPRKCGIASFSNDLFHHISNDENEVSVVAMNDLDSKYDYPEEVKYQIRQNYRNDYILAADFLNLKKIECVCLQHEFGLFGGSDGKYITQLLARLHAPVVTTLHTILDEPTQNQQRVLNDIVELSSKVVVMSERGARMLREIYGVDKSKIRIIGHGIHDIKIFNTKCYKKALNIEDRKVLLTFGLLSKNKGIETVIKALPKVVEHHPNVVYIVLGATHPHVLNTEGEDYRNSLIRLTKKLNIENNVIFLNRYVSNDDLFSYLLTSDIYVIPYLSKKQITSGTLVYAMGTKNAVISTPFWHAEEALANDNGILFDFNDVESLSNEIIDLLNNEEKLKFYQSQASNYAKNFLWKNVGNDYVKLFSGLEFHSDLSLPDNKMKLSESNTLPEVNLNHLLNLTDDTGIFQHARFNFPDRKHGYCLDDNARALLLTTLLQKKLGNNNQINQLFSIYFSFVDHAYDPEVKRFRNFMAYNRTWLENIGSEDSQGRTIWALGCVMASTHNSNTLGYTQDLFQNSLEIIPELKHPRAISYALLGVTEYLSVYTHNTEVRNILEYETKRLFDFFAKNIENPEWPWFDNLVTYGNNRIAEALIHAGFILKNEEIENAGLMLLDWLIENQFENKIFVPIGNDGWLTPNGKAQFDQQPLEAYGMIDACLLANNITGNPKYKDFAMKAFDWFLGDNLLGISIYDFSTGGCRDGLNPNETNKNQGAESTISFLASLLKVKLHP